LLSACAPSEEPALPDPPAGAELVIQLGDLEVYNVSGDDLCAGTLRRISLQIDGLVESFAFDPPRARVFVYADSGQVEAACDRKARGCTQSWGAHTMPDAVTHELVHVFVNGATDHARARPMIAEGVADYLSGNAPGLGSPLGAGWESQEQIPSLADLESMLAIRSIRSSAEFTNELVRRKARHFCAWAIDRFGVEAMLEAHVATAAADDTDAQIGLAESFGHSSLADLHAEYAATRAVGYPAAPVTVRVFTSSELSEGVVLDTSCRGDFTEGPMDTELMTVVHLEISKAGEHAFAFGELPMTMNPPRLQLTTPIHEQPAFDQRRAAPCGYDWSPMPLHFDFPLAGQYEITARDCEYLSSVCLGRHEADEAAKHPLSLQYLDHEDCEPF
jgi:hypothetical protein